MRNRRAKQPGKNASGRNRMSGGVFRHRYPWRQSYEMARIEHQLSNTITLLCYKHNMMLFSSDPRRLGPWSILFGPEGLHLGTQAMDEMLDVKRQRHAVLNRNVGIEFGRFDDSQLLNAWEPAIGDGELIDDGDTKTGLDQCADGSAEPCADGDIVAQFLAGEDFGHDAAIGVSRINADQRIPDHFRCGYLLATRKFVAFGDDAKQLARRKRKEV